MQEKLCKWLSDPDVSAEVGGAAVHSLDKSEIWNWRGFGLGNKKCRYSKQPLPFGSSWLQCLQPLVLWKRNFACSLSYFALLLFLRWLSQCFPARAQPIGCSTFSEGMLHFKHLTISQADRKSTISIYQCNCHDLMQRILWSGYNQELKRYVKEWKTPLSPPET